MNSTYGCRMTIGISKEDLEELMFSYGDEVSIAYITEKVLDACKELDTPNNKVKSYSEWYNSLSRIITNHYDNCSRYELAEAVFNAGYEAGKNTKSITHKELPEDPKE